MSERGVSVDHATLNRWVVKYSPLAARVAQKRKANTAESWRMDEGFVANLRLRRLRVNGVSDFERGGQ